MQSLFYIKPTKVQNDECVFDDPKAIWVFAVIRFTSVLADRSRGIIIECVYQGKHDYYDLMKKTSFPIHYEACDISPIHHWGGP